MNRRYFHMLKLYFIRFSMKRADYMLNGMKDGHKYTENIGCIEIGNNVFIGADAKILYDVRIGDNVIIAAGALSQ